MFEESRVRTPFKVWDCWRNVRRAVVVASFKELQFRAKEKLGISPTDSVQVVLESDGTPLDVGDFFNKLPNNTVLIILKDNEYWQPMAIDTIRSALKAIPSFVCEQIVAKNFQDKMPLCKVLYNNGPVTVVLHWSQNEQAGTQHKESCMKKFPSSAKDRHIRFQENKPDSTESDDTTISNDSPAIDLVLYDQLTDIRKRHLTTEEFHEILNQLKEIIPEVHEMKLSQESPESFLWIITAQVRGGKWEHEGVTYKNNYYPIKHHFFPKSATQ